MLICLIGQLEEMAMERTIRIPVGLIIGLNVSL